MWGSHGSDQPPRHEKLLENCAGNYLKSCTISVFSSWTNAILSCAWTLKHEDVLYLPQMSSNDGWFFRKGVTFRLAMSKRDEQIQCVIFFELILDPVDGAVHPLALWNHSFQHSLADESEPTHFFVVRWPLVPPTARANQALVWAIIFFEIRRC